MWGKVAMVPLLRQTIRFLLDDGPRWPSAVVPTVNEKGSVERGARLSQPCLSTEGRTYPTESWLKRGGRLGHGRLR
jgi:hypothetical protein